MPVPAKAAQARQCHHSRQTRPTDIRDTVGNREFAQLLREAMAESESFAALPNLQASDGKPIEAGDRVKLEAQFGTDFRGVRIHTDTSAAEAARQAKANAFTIGNHIVFGAGRYAPETSRGRNLLAHELAHVVQQSRASSAPGSAAQSPDLERDASHAAEASASGGSSVQVGGASPVGVARQGERATFGNLPQDAPQSEARRWRLIEEGGRWYTEDSRGNRFTARGTYAFVVQGGNTWVVRPTGAMGGGGPGHTEAARGGRVEYAGLVNFSSAPGSRGTLRSWSNASGHYLPVSSFAQASGLPMDKFEPYRGGGVGGIKGQLPVFQPPAGATISPVEPPEKAAAPPAAEPARAAAPLAAAPAAPARGKLSITIPSRRPPPMIEPSQRGEAIGGGIILGLEAAHSVLSYFADKYQQERAQKEFERILPEIQKAQNETGKGVTVFFHYTSPKDRPDVRTFDFIEWQVGHAAGPTDVLHSADTSATAQKTYIPPVKEAAERTDEGAAQYRIENLWERQKIYQRAAERMSKEGLIGRFLRDRKGDHLEMAPIYDARAHLTSATIAIRQKRFGAAQDSMDRADDRLDEMLDNFKAYGVKF
jgi:Domain of unknown function (DUF4157)